ncbi:MAG: IPT/TIG domain-containing protein [Polyangiaceae bacterium]
MVPAREHGPVDIVITNPDGQSAVLAGKLRFAEGPVIESVEPAVAVPSGGTRVMLSGRNFARGCTVTLMGTLAPQVAYESDKRLLFTAPAHEAARGAVRVTNPDGLTVVLEDAFEYRAAPPPVLAQSTPDRAWVTGGARLLVSGSDFGEGATATIGGKEAAVKWKNGGLLEVMVPAGSDVGATDLVVTNPDGQSATVAFTYERVPTPPKLIAVTPSRGPTHGNVTVVLTGDNFDEQTVVRIGEVRTTTKVLSQTEMEVLVPPRVKEGPVAIELVSGEGVAVRSEDVFYYNDQPPPKITGVSPNQGPMSGNTRVSLEGEGFTQDCFVRIARERPKSITIKGPQLIEIVTPPCKISGFVDIEVGTNQTGSSTAKNAFRFVALPPPSIDSVAPNRGTTNGGTEMSIAGKHFNAESVVKIGGTAVKFKLISPDLIECKTPPGDDGKMADVSVKNPDGKEAVSRRAFQYDARYRG